MSSKTSIALAAAVAAAALPAAALAAGSSTVPATPSSLHVDGAYAFHGSYAPSTKQYVFVVFKTHGQLPRRYDGLIRAGARLGSARGGSVGSVGGRASRCYLVTLPLKDGRFYAPGGSEAAKASNGTRRTLTVSAKDAAAKEITATRPVTIRKARAGDMSGKPLGC